MADHDHRARIVAQHFLQQVQRLEVEVVGRLVEDQEVRRQRQRPGQRQPAALAARELFHRGARLLGGEQEILHVADDVLGYPVDDQRVAAAGGERFLERRRRVEGAAALVQRRQFEVGAEPHAARIRLELAGQHADQGGLAGAIGSDNADAVAADHPGGKIPDDDAVAETLGDVLGLDHHLARSIRLRDLQLDLAGSAALLAPFLAQAGQPFQPPHVALAPRGDAIGQPVLLAHDLAVELVAVELLFLQHGVAPFLERAETLVEPAGHPAIEPDAGPGQVGEEAAVVADDDEGRLDVLELGLQPLDGRQVEVVGRLIEEDDVRLGRQHPGQGRAAGLAAGEPGRILVALQSQRVEQICAAIVVVARLHAVLDIAKRGGEAGEVRLLRQVADGDARLQEAAAGIGFDLAGGDLEQGGFAGAVAADKRDLVAGGHRQLSAFEHRRAADRQPDILQGKNWRCGHGAFRLCCGVGRIEHGRG